jgi:hypothetical protein
LELFYMKIRILIKFNWWIISLFGVFPFAYQYICFSNFLIHIKKSNNNCNFLLNFLFLFFHNVWKLIIIFYHMWKIMFLINILFTLNLATTQLFFIKNKSKVNFNRPMMFTFKCLKILDNFILFFHPIFL